ncbi:MAG: MerR family transcriptional regulator [Rhizobacter sp.]|jgi:DNA-binding transcriptional MerR regulator|nr:MerR family transcriptional regulator [Rhizobacter sp.]
MATSAAALATPPVETSRTFTISELAAEFDLTTRAIRFYEDMGLLTPQRVGRARVYTARDRTRLKLTLRGKRLGLSLAEAKQVVDMYESPRDTVAQMKALLVVLGKHREHIEQQMADLQSTLDEVRAHEKEARKSLTAAERREAAEARR